METNFASSSARADVGLIGGSGLYRLDGVNILATLIIDTPYGPPSSPVTLAELSGRTLAFLTRHGAGHSVAPHLVNYRANIWALKSLGVRAVVSSSAVGGIGTGYQPGDFVVPDQVIDRTHGRADTFYSGTTGGVQHLPAADPFCSELRKYLADALGRLDESFHQDGTVVVVQGPRFSTRAESAWFAAAGGHVISMTQYPEPMLAAELNMGFATLAFVTDSDVGRDGEASVDAQTVFARLKEAQPRVVAAISRVIESLSADYRPELRIDPAAVAAIMAQERTPAAGKAAI